MFNLLPPQPGLVHDDGRMDGSFLHSTKTFQDFSRLFKTFPALLTLRKASFCSMCLLMRGSSCSGCLSPPPHQSSSLRYSCSRLSSTDETGRVTPLLKLSSAVLTRAAAGRTPTPAHPDDLLIYNQPETGRGR